MDGLRGLLESETQAVLRHAADADLSTAAEVMPDDETAETYRRPDSENYAAFRAATALYVVNPHDPEIVRLLGDMLALQRLHVKELHGDGEARNTLVSPLFLFYGLNSLRSRPVVERDIIRRAIIAKLESFSKAISQFIDGDRDPKNAVLRVANARHISSEQIAFDTVIGRVLRTGEHYQHLQTFLGLHQQALPMLPLSPDELSDMTGLARYYHTYGEQVPWAHILTDRGVHERLVTNEVAALKVTQNPGAGAPSPWTKHVTATARITADDALTCAHALLREPQMFGGGEPTDPGLRASVIVSKEAFAELIDRFRSEPAWGGIEPFTIGRRPLAEDLIIGDIHEPKPRHVHVGAAAILRARISNRDITVRFMLPTAETAARSDRTRAQLIEEAIADIAGSDISLNVPAPGTLEEWGREPVERIANTYRPGALSLETSHDLLGQERCLHEGGYWTDVYPRKQGGRMPSSYRRLACLRCLRGYVATAPAHCDPDASLGVNTPTEHVLAYRAQQAFFGERLPDDVTIEDLRERDQNVSLAPADYAIDTARAPMRRRGPLERRRGALAFGRTSRS